jgi:hypothetical protein
MRARFAERIRELRRTLAESAVALERATEQGETERRDRLDALAAEIEAIDGLRARSGAVAATLG